MLQVCPNDTDTDAAILRERDVADRLGISVSSLRRMRVRGDGPPSLELGVRVRRWRESDVEAWLNEHAGR